MLEQRWCLCVLWSTVSRLVKLCTKRWPEFMSSQLCKLADQYEVLRFFGLFSKMFESHMIRESLCQNLLYLQNSSFYQGIHWKILRSFLDIHLAALASRNMQWNLSLKLPCVTQFPPTVVEVCLLCNRIPRVINSSTQRWDLLVGLSTWNHEACFGSTSELKHPVVTLLVLTECIYALYVVSGTIMKHVDIANVSHESKAMAKSFTERAVFSRNPP